MPMNISLTPHLEEMIREKIASGSYNSASEVVRSASPHGTGRSVAISEAAETPQRCTGRLGQRIVHRVRPTRDQAHCAREEITEEWEVSVPASD